MVNTLETTKVSDIGDMTTLKAGRWYIYAVTLNPTQVAAANACTKVGFAKPGDTNKTSYSKSVLLAKTDEYTGAYNTTARTLEELEGQVFVVQARATATSQLTFLGEWQTELALFRYTGWSYRQCPVSYDCGNGKGLSSEFI